MINNIVILVILIIIIISLAKFAKFNAVQEEFNLNNLTEHTGLETSESYIYTLIPKYYDEDGYIGTYITKDFKESTDELKNNLIQTYSLQTNKWVSQPIANGGIFFNNKNYVIHDLTWSQDILNEFNNPVKKLIAVGMIFNQSAKEYEYKTFIKKTAEIDSIWEPLFPNSDIDKNIICLRYDLNNNLIGINKEDYQIYKFKFKSKLNLDPTFHGIWNGPINFDSSVLLHKILFDVDKHLLAIDHDGKIFKKKNLDWEQSEWIKSDSKHSKITSNTMKEGIINDGIYDLVHDYDGKFIATTQNGLVKQVTNSWDSDFISYDEQKNKNVKINSDDNLISKNTILICRTGNDSNKYDYLRDNESDVQSDSNYSRKAVIEKLNYFLNLKRKLRNVCKNNNSNTWNI